MTKCAAKRLIGPGIIALCCGVIFGQTTPVFEVASVKRDLSGGKGGAVHATPGAFTAANSTLQGLIRYAYGVRDYQIQGPGWMDTERYDIEARIGGEHDSQEIRLMLQNLLAERFGLKLRRVVRQMPVYALVVAKSGSKLRESHPGGPASVGSTNHSIVAGKITMQDFAAALSAQMDRPVLDSTELPGTFEVNIEWTPESGATNTVPLGASLFTVLQEQLGLKLESRTGPVETLVVDHVEKVPTDN